MAWRCGSSERTCSCFDGTLLFMMAYGMVGLFGLILIPIVIQHLPSPESCDGGSTICTALVCHAKGSQPRRCTGEGTFSDHDGHGMLVNSPCQLTFDVPHNVAASSRISGFFFWKRSKSAIKSLFFSNQSLCLPMDPIHSLCQPVFYHDTLNVYSFTTIDGMGNVLMYFVDGELSVLVDVNVYNVLKTKSYNSSGSADLWKTVLNCSDHHETPQLDVHQVKRVEVILVAVYNWIVVASNVQFCLMVAVAFCWVAGDILGCDFCNSCFYQCNSCNCCNFLKLMTTLLRRMMYWTVAKGNSLCLRCKGLRLRRVRVTPLITETPSDDLEYVQEKDSISAHSDDTHSIMSAVSEKGRGSSRMVPSHPWSGAFQDHMSSSRSETELTQFPHPHGNIRSPSLNSCASAKSEVGRDSGQLATSTFLRLTDHSLSCCKLNSNAAVFKVRPVQSDIQPDLPSLKHYIVPTVAAKMKEFGIFLGVENAVVDKVKMNYPMDCERACEEMLKLWFANDIGTGDKPRTWPTVLNAYEEAGYREQAIALRRKLNEKESPV